jgi:hypothetical protein
MSQPLVAYHPLSSLRTGSPLATRLLAVAVFLLAAALYIRTAGPTLGGAFDSEEFQHAAYKLSVAHATGYPLYLILGTIFTTIFPIGNVAYRMNVLSALLGAGAGVLIYLTALQLTRRQIASLAATALFATNVSVWRQAGVASVGSLHLLLVAAILYALLLWHEKRASLTLAAFVFGLSLTHHRSTLLLAPAIALFVLLTDFNIMSRPRDLARNFLWLALPLLLYLYIPLRGSTTPWYNNTLQGFIGEISGGDAGDFIRVAPLDLAQGVIQVTQYLFDSFGYLGLALVAVGTVTVAPRWNRWTTALNDSRVALFLGFSTLLFVVWGTLYGGEPDRYLVLPFFFLVFWFAIGAGAVEILVEQRIKANSMRRGAIMIVVAALALLVVVPFGDRFRAADWSSYDRVYKQWDEIFSLPIPRSALLVGNWGQLNAMRYMQHVENRRADLRFVGTLYDPTPQTDAARDAFAERRAIFLSPGIALPTGAYRYGLLGPLLEVRDAPQMQPPGSIPVPKNVALNPSLSLVGFGVSTALEAYQPSDTVSIAPNRTARVALYWRAEGSQKDFIVRIRLYDPEARLIAQKDEPPVRGVYPASQWQRGEYVSDVHNFLIPAGSPPGNYQLKMTTLDAETKAQTHDEIALALLTIERATNLARDQIFVQHPLDIDFDRRIALWGYGGFEGTHHADETISINLLWHTRENIGEDLTLHLVLVDSLGKVVKVWQRAPIAFYPTREWQPGETLKAYYDLQLPDTVPPGDLSLAVALSQQAAVTIAKIQIEP